jgi:hypothetical protein
MQTVEIGFCDEMEEVGFSRPGSRDSGGFSPYLKRILAQELGKRARLISEELL